MTTKVPRANGHGVDIRSEARSYGKSMIKVLHGLATNDETPPATRALAANSLLDRGYGKPMQAVALTDEDGQALDFTISFVPATPKTIEVDYTEVDDDVKLLRSLDSQHE